jgi:hypothetical protein
VTLLVARTERVSRASPGLRTSSPGTTNTAAWSHDLLDDDARAAFDRLRVFSERSLLDGPGRRDRHGRARPAGLPRPAPVPIEDRARLDTRYLQLATLRQLAEDRIGDAGALDETRARHLAWVQQLAVTVLPTGAGPAMARYIAELDNICVAVAFAVTTERFDAANQVMSDLSACINARPTFEALQWADPAAGTPPGTDAQTDVKAAPVWAPLIERSPLVGRRDDLERLRAAWRMCAGGCPQFVLVTGEPGIGKSRLVEHFRGWCADQGGTAVAGRAYEAEGAVSYGPVVDLLRSDAVSASFGALDPMWSRELARFLPELSAGPSAPRDGHGEGTRERLFEAIGRALLVPGRPLALVIDDVHWCDGDTLDLLEFVVRSAQQLSSPLLVVGTARTEELASQRRLRAFVGRLHMLDAMVEVPLSRLDPDDADLLVRGLLGEEATATAVDRLVTAAEGNPLFLVELARFGLVERPRDDATGQASRSLPASRR